MTTTENAGRTAEDYGVDAIVTELPEWFPTVDIPAAPRPEPRRRRVMPADRLTMARAILNITSQEHDRCWGDDRLVRERCSRALECLDEGVLYNAVRVINSIVSVYGGYSTAGKLAMRARRYVLDEIVNREMDDVADWD